VANSPQRQTRCGHALLQHTEKCVGTTLTVRNRMVCVMHPIGE